MDNATGSGSTDQGCLSGMSVLPPHDTKVKAQFVDGTAPQFDEVLATGSGAGRRWGEIEKRLRTCKRYSVSQGGTTEHFTVRAMSFPTVGQRSSAYSMTVSVDGMALGADLVLFQVGKVYGAVVYAQTGSADPTQAQAFITEAVDKVEGKLVS